MTSARLALLFIAAIAVASPAVAQRRQAPPAAQTAGNKIVPVGDVFPFLDRFYGLPAADRSLFRLAYRVRIGERPFTGRMWYVDPANRRTAIALGAAGEVRTLPTAQMLSGRGWRLEAEAPAATEFGVNMELQPTLPPAAEMPAAPLAQTITQVNGAVRRAAGMMRFAAPTMTRVIFLGARGGEVVLADGRVAPLPVVGGAANFTPSAFPTARTLRFAQAPVRMQIAPAAQAPRRRR